MALIYVHMYMAIVYVPNIGGHCNLPFHFVPRLGSVSDAGQELKLEDKALLYEALSSETVFNPNAFADSQASSNHS